MNFHAHGLLMHIHASVHVPFTSAAKRAARGEVGERIQSPVGSPVFLSH